MAQALSKYISKEVQAKILIGAPTGTFAVGDVIANNAVLASATFFAKVKKVVIAGAGNVDSYLIVEPFGPLNINGTVRESTAIVADGGTVYGYVQSSGASTSASAVVDTVTGADGADIVIDAKGISRVTKIGSRVVTEVLVAIRDFATKQAA